MHTAIPSFVGFAKAPWNKGRSLVRNVLCDRRRSGQFASGSGGSTTSDGASTGRSVPLSSTSSTSYSSTVHIFSSGRECSASASLVRGEARRRNGETG